MRRAGLAVETPEDLGAHYRRDKWAFSTPLYDVYAGEDLRLHRDVHLRFFTPRVMRDASVASAVLAGAKQAAAVVHPHHVAVYDIGTIGGRLCVVTEVTEAPERSADLSTDELAGLANADASRAARALGLLRNDVAAPTPVTETQTMAMPPIVDDPSPAVEDPSPIPPRPPEDPSPQPIPVATTTEAPRPEKPKRARPRLPQGAAARFAPFAAVAAAVIAMLVFAFNDDPPPIPGYPVGHPGQHTHLPPEIPQ